MQYRSWSSITDDEEYSYTQISVAVPAKRYYTMYDWCLAYESSDWFECKAKWSKEVNNIGSGPTMTGYFYFRDDKDATMFALQCLGAKDE